MAETTAEYGMGSRVVGRSVSDGLSTDGGEMAQILLENITNEPQDGLCCVCDRWWKTGG